MRLTLYKMVGPFMFLAVFLVLGVVVELCLHRIAKGARTAPKTFSAKPGPVPDPSPDDQSLCSPLRLP